MPSSPEQDLSLHPFVRGFWTDEEMFEASGVTSVAVIKSMQAAKLVRADRYKTAHGKWARAWSFRDIFVFALAVDVATETGFNMHVAVELLRALGTEIIEAVLCINETKEKLRNAFDELSSSGSMLLKNGMPKPWESTPIILHRSEVVDLKIVDREFVFCLAPPDPYAPDELESRPIGLLTNVKTTKPQIVFTEDMALPTFELMRSDLVIHLNTLAERPVYHGCGIRAEVNPWVR
ncbi:hypothetical protein [Hyphomonas sp.]|uniref:hypothetical protein n=1 Tax=Hyphomonas sp. TaxID=87 RepID=UPI0025B934E7|nr:hypothetical protein [Hyphomonas sp.]